jgi:hypothetical protein
MATAEKTKKKKEVDHVHPRPTAVMKTQKPPVDILAQSRRSREGGPIGRCRPRPRATCPAEEAHVALAPTCRYLAPRIVPHARPRNGRTGWVRPCLRSKSNCPYVYVVGCALACGRNQIQALFSFFLNSKFLYFFIVLNL